MLLTIDVGNTTTSSAVFEAHVLIEKYSLPTPRSADARFVRQLVANKTIPQITAVVVSSVVPFLDGLLHSSLIDQFGPDIDFIDHHTPTGMGICIDRPEELGADRIADSVGALALMAPPLIVVDSGTATTFDIVDRHRNYIGGAILPGIGLSLKSLAENTAKLDLVHFQPPHSILGTNTTESMRSGIFYSYIGGLSYMIGEYKKLIGNDASVVATGGLTGYFKDRVPGIDSFEPDLIHIGLKRIFDYSATHSPRRSEQGHPGGVQ